MTEEPDTTEQELEAERHKDDRPDATEEELSHTVDKLEGEGDGEDDNEAPEDLQ